MTFNCRTILPTVSAWTAQEGASPEGAAAEFWVRAWRHGRGAEFRRGPGDVVAFARVEVEGHGSMVARMFWRGLVRKGGVTKKRPMTLEDVARAIGWEDDPAELLGDGWECEETEQEAEAMKGKR